MNDKELYLALSEKQVARKEIYDGAFMIKTDIRVPIGYTAEDINSAIVNRKRPCQVACKVKAISINEDNAAAIDNDKCIQCGACIDACPKKVLKYKLRWR